MSGGEFWLGDDVEGVAAALGGIVSGVCDEEVGFPGDGE